MYRENVVRGKAYEFALKIIITCRNPQIVRESIIHDQLLKSGTSIGANIEEAIDAQSKADFISKLSIGLKEARETDYWLRLMESSGILDKQNTLELRGLLSQIIALLVTTIRKSKQNSELKG